MIGQKKLREIQAIPLLYRRDMIIGLPLMITLSKIVHLQSSSIKGKQVPTIG